MRNGRTTEWSHKCWSRHPTFRSIFGFSENADFSGIGICPFFDAQNGRWKRVENVGKKYPRDYHRCISTSFFSGRRVEMWLWICYQATNTEIWSEPCGSSPPLVSNVEATSLTSVTSSFSAICRGPITTCITWSGAHLAPFSGCYLLPRKLTYPLKISDWKMQFFLK